MLIIQITVIKFEFIKCNICISWTNGYNSIISDFIRFDSVICFITTNLIINTTRFIPSNNSKSICIVYMLNYCIYASFNFITNIYLFKNVMSNLFKILNVFSMISVICDVRFSYPTKL